MIATTTSIFGPNFDKDLVHMMLQDIDTGTEMGYRMIWDALIYLLIHNWVLVLGLLTFFLVVAIIKYLFTGRWAMLGSVLYNYAYYGFLFLMGLILGPDIFTNDWIDLILLFVYVISFILVRIILNRTGIRRR